MSRTAGTVEAGRAPRAAFFDLDGCLVDSRAAITRCLNVGLAAVGARLRAPEELYRLIGPPLHESFEGLLVEQGAGRELAGRCVEAYRDAYAEVSLTHTTPVDGIAGALERIAQSTTLAVVTSKPATFATPILQEVGLDGYFAAVHAPDLAVRAEPKALTLARALEDVMPGVRPGDTVMVGDRHHDVDAGVACGTRTLGVGWGIGTASELAHADRVVDRPAELPAAVLQ